MRDYYILIMLGKDRSRLYPKKSSRKKVVLGCFVHLAFCRSTQNGFCDV